MVKKWFETFSPASLRKSAHMWLQIMYKTGGGRPKKKIYHRVHELDRVMDLQKKPSLILQLKSIIESQRNQSLLLRDLEKEVGFVQKWNFMNVIEKYPTVFYVTCAGGTPPAVMLSRKAKEIAVDEGEVRAEMEPILIKNLRKLLMLSVDCRVPLANFDLIQNELGLPPDYKNSLISKYPEFFSVKGVNGRDYLHLENWDSSLAVTAREERWACERESKLEEGIKPTRTSKDGNFSGPFAFHVSFPAGFRPNKGYLEEVVRWQKMEFPSPYLNARRFDIADPKARKRVVGVLHELLSLTMEKRLTSAQLEAFHSEYRLPAKLLLCFIKQHGIFYITNKGVKSSVFLKEAYNGSNLIHKCPLLVFRDRFIALMGRKDINSFYNII
ncbi:PREDICTED: protein ROOT PRIMORDIUM DEFECTIVE 1-like [Ipomoea nil]|uniref:protein ROOT PRIMORDIUM DEFECTIVE 1-like n=1 Tax=Ipomoea nil TaxID=35883 RepID=UPI0009011EA7|nr:PREDICTED: protein ROOT PRIMORDIUM DEFECTIVE 1-like [Ipomoea nil]XP_019177521.1 PREDICTED: protein ROOT PRIMORDIUM DEFECTIVE 1-like [Ipomoea nil]